MAPLAFLSHRGPHAIERLSGELTRRGLRAGDLLRLRLLAAGPAELLGIEQAFERLLPRSHWPALSVAYLAGADGGMPGVDAIAAAGAYETRIAVREDPPKGSPIASSSAASPELRAPEAMRFGQWLFVGALAGAGEPSSDRTAPAKRSARADVPAQIEAQSRELFARMERLLAAGGAEMRDVVKVGGWLSFPMSQYEPLARVRRELLEQCELLPASAAVQTGPLPGGALLSFEAIAFVPQRSSPTLPDEEQLPVPRHSPLATYYANARRAGEYVFTCGEIPRKPDSVEREARDVCEQLRDHLAEYGAAPQDVVQQTVFVRRREDLAVVERELGSWSGAFGVATTVVPAIDMGFRAGVGVEVELVAVTS